MTLAPTLYVLSGPPASGKTTIARAIARARCASHLRIDTIEQSLIDLFHVPLDERGHAFAKRLAADDLRNGVSVVIDACNLHPEARAVWPPFAECCGVRLVVIEIRCSDEAEHRHRVEHRAADPPHLQLPAWREVQSRSTGATAWELATIRHDTAGRTIAASGAQVLRELAASDARSR